jgi:GntR family transcriptional regulator, transcriptional repressor for pyruvate dehydrogenase complex
MANREISFMSVMRVKLPNSKQQEITPLSSAELAEKISMITKKRKALDRSRLESVTCGDSIVPILISYIRDMKLTAGDKLPTEVGLSEALKVGRRSVREALTTLKALGVVDAQQGSGWYVTEFKPLINLPTILAPLLEYFNGISVREVFEARLETEPIIAKLAARNSTPEGLARLGETLEVMRKYIEEKSVSNEFKLIDRKFHDILAEMCCNEVLALQNSILSGLFLAMSIAPPETNRYGALQEHEEIYRKVEAKDAEGAALVAKRHLELGLQFVHKLGLG